MDEPGASSAVRSFVFAKATPRQVAHSGEARVKTRLRCVFLDLFGDVVIGEVVDVGGRGVVFFGYFLGGVVGGVFG